MRASWIEQVWVGLVRFEVALVVLRGGEVQLENLVERGLKKEQSSVPLPGGKLLPVPQLKLQVASDDSLHDGDFLRASEVLKRPSYHNRARVLERGEAAFLKLYLFTKCRSIEEEEASWPLLVFRKEPPKFIRRRLSADDPKRRRRLSVN